MIKRIFQTISRIRAFSRKRREIKYPVHFEKEEKRRHHKIPLEMISDRFGRAIKRLSER